MLKQKIIPVVKRVTEFEPLNRSDENPLVICGENDVFYYSKEIPQRAYQCDKNACYEMKPDYRLNSFVKCIMVSVVDDGYRVRLSDGKVKKAKKNGECVVYYEDNRGICHEVIRNDIYNLLLKNPKLIVSPEGMLIFYTKHSMIATLDMQHYYWINNERGYKGITFPQKSLTHTTIAYQDVILHPGNIDNDGWCEIIAKEEMEKKIAGVYGCLVDEIIHHYELKFKFNSTDYNTITVSMKEISQEINGISQIVDG